METLTQNFSSLLIKWYKQNKRSLPWRETKEPYLIWLSEIILQQTRIDQGLAYYEKFARNYPTVFDLAKASEDSVLADWQGLGYYSRARNLHFTAKYIANELNGKFPSSFKDLQSLKGVGRYTAAAIASFCFKQVVPVVDGNVARVLCRHFKIERPIDVNQTQKLLFELASSLIDQTHPDTFNQAIMEFGALHCTPKNPKCTSCVFSDTCMALRDNKVEVLPFKSKKLKKTNRYLDYIFFHNKTELLCKKRTQGIWKGLYQGLLIEHASSHPKGFSDQKLVNYLKQSSEIRQLEIKKHVLSHQNLFIRTWFVWHDNLEEIAQEQDLEIRKIKRIKEIGFPIVLADQLYSFFEI